MLAALYMTNDSSTTKEMGWTEFQKLANKNVFENRPGTKDHKARRKRTFDAL